jgi:ribonuclease P protein component
MEGTYGVDPIWAIFVPLKANLRMQPSSRWVTNHDADVQSPEPEKKKQARVPGPDADQGRAEDPEPAAPEGPATVGGERRLEVEPMALACPEAGTPGRFGLPPASRITRTRDIRALLRRGKRKKTSHLDVFFLSSGGSLPRLGIVVPKHRHRVVDRNKVKRRLREIGRREFLPRMRDAGQFGDVLVRARREAYGASYQQLRRELIETAEELCSGPLSWR